MEEIKVYLQYPWKYPDSPYYKSLINYPPNNVRYLNSENQKGAITNKKKFFLSNKLKSIIRNSFNSLHLSLPNAHLSPKGDYDLIHCAHCLSKNKDKPWVADFEDVWQMFIGERTERAKKEVKKILSNKSCKFIAVWTERAKIQILKEYPSIKNKIKVIYPAIPVPKIKRKKHKGINLFFVGRYFAKKGGREALETMDRLTKKYSNVNGMVVSDVPIEIHQKYAKNRRIKFFDLIPQKELFEKVYSEGDIFIYPGYSDSFGFAFLEAMSFGIPVITVDGFARKEIIEDGKTGFIINRPKMIWKKDIPQIEENEKLIDSLVEKTEILISERNLRKKMSRKCINVIKGGKFSISGRNNKLSRVYREAIR